MSIRPKGYINRDWNAVSYANLSGKSKADMIYTVYRYIEVNSVIDTIEKFRELFTVTEEEMETKSYSFIAYTRNSETKKLEKKAFIENVDGIVGVEFEMGTNLVMVLPYIPSPYVKIMVPKEDKDDVMINDEETKDSYRIGSVYRAVDGVTKKHLEDLDTDSTGKCFVFKDITADDGELRLIEDEETIASINKDINSGQPISAAIANEFTKFGMFRKITKSIDKTKDFAEIPTKDFFDGFIL